MHPSRQTLEVVAVVPNEQPKLAPNQAVELEIPLGESTRTVTRVPSNALLRNGQVAWVLVEGDDGELQKRLVQPGQPHEDWVEIQEGLAPGEQVAVDEST